MSYRNKTYVIFDGDNDMWAYAYMMGWKNREHIDFNFHNAHDLAPIAERVGEETVKRQLRERFSSAKQVIVLVGEHTKNLSRFVRWEMQVAQRLGLPIIAVNLNGRERVDTNLCPPMLCDEYVVHIPFKAKIIRHALDNFPDEFARRASVAQAARHYDDSVYQKLGL